MSEEAYILEGFPNPENDIFIDKKHLKAIIKRLHEVYQEDFGDYWEYTEDTEERWSDDVNFQTVLDNINALSDDSPFKGQQNWKAFFNKEGHLNDLRLGYLRYSYCDYTELMYAIHPYVDPGAYMFKTESHAEAYPRMKVTFDNKNNPGPDFEIAREIYNEEDAVAYLLKKFPGTASLDEVKTALKLKKSLKN